MFATREGVLEIDCIFRPGVSRGDLCFSISLVLSLRTIGRVPVIAPYVRISAHGWSAAERVENLTSRISANGSMGIYATRDVLVHPGDDIGIAEIATGLDFRRTGQFEIAAAVASARTNGANCFLMIPWSEMLPTGYKTNDKAISVSGYFGAENAAPKPFSFEIGKMELLELFARHHSL